MCVTQFWSDTHTTPKYRLIYWTRLGWASEYSRHTHTILTHGRAHSHIHMHNNFTHVRHLLVPISIFRNTLILVCVSIVLFVSLVFVIGITELSIRA